MKKKELVQKVCSTVRAHVPGASVTQNLVETIIDTTCDAIAADLIMGGETRLPHLGLLYTINRAERQVREPQTGELMVIPAHRSLRLRMGSEMKEALR